MNEDKGDGIMGKQKVGVIFGGKSSEHEVSLQSAKNIIEAIDRSMFEVVLIGIDKSGTWHLFEESSYLLHANDPQLIRLNTPMAPVMLPFGDEGGQLRHAQTGEVLMKIDVAFPIIHGTSGEDGRLQGVLRLANIPFVGPDVLSSAICMDKDIAKRLLNLANIKVAKGLTFRRTELETISYTDVSRELGTTLFIKPANQGSSVGVSKTTTKESFEAAITEAFKYDHKLVVEEAINGREIECSVLGNEEPIVSLPGEILPQTEFYSYESKYIDDDGADLQVPAKLSDELVEKVQQICLKAYQTLECEGLARVDVFVTADDEVYVNEINTLPGFTKISMYPKLWEVSGLSYMDLVTRLIKLALERNERDQWLKSSVVNGY